LIYAAIFVVFCVIFSAIWLEVGGLDPRTIAKQLVDSGMQIPGFRRSERPIEVILKRYIPAVTILGGLIVGLLANWNGHLTLGQHSLSILSADNEGAARRVVSWT